MAYTGSSKAKYFYSVNDLETLFHPSYVTKKRNERYEFTIRDPFNNTYNPAKNLLLSARSASSHLHSYDKHFESALKKLLHKQRFIC